MSNADIINNILRREGDAYTHDPLDRGGSTKYGITQRAWNDYIAHDPANAPTRDVEVLTRDMAIAFYATMYTTPLTFIDNENLRELVIDSAVQHGSTRAVQWLQRAAEVEPVDGVIGPKTVAAVSSVSDSLADVNWQKQIYTQYLKMRLRFYAGIVANEPAQARFIRGWVDRVLEFLR